MTAGQNLPHVLHHFLDGGVEGRFSSVPKALLPELVNPAWTVMLHNKIVCHEGLFPCHFPDILVYSPSYKLHNRWVVRGLTLTEQLRLHQLPLSMDPLLAGLNSRGVLPFEDVPSPEIYTSIFCQLWGTYVGGLGLNKNRGGLNENQGGAKVEENGVLEGTVEQDGVIEDDFVEDGVTEETVVETANGDVVEVTANGDVAETANVLDTATVCPAPSVLSLQATDAGVTTTVPPAHSALPSRVVDESMTALQIIASGPDMSSTLSRGEGRGNVLDFDFVPGRNDNT
jgi:hypothetical protein